MSLTEIEIVRDEAGGKAYPWSVRKVVAPVYGPAPPPWATAADVEQAIRSLRPQLSLVPEGTELRVTVLPPELRPRILWRVTERRWCENMSKAKITFVEAADRSEATEIVYAKVASEAKGPTSMSRVSASVHTPTHGYSIEKARSWDPFEAQAAG